MWATLEVLVLVAGERDAVICSNCNGNTHFIRCCHDASVCEGCEAEFLGRDSRAPARFARELIAMLEHDMDDHAYDSVVILADASIYDDFRRTGGGTLSHLLMPDPVAPSVVGEAMKRATACLNHAAVLAGNRH